MTTQGPPAQAPPDPWWDAARAADESDSAAADAAKKADAERQAQAAWWQRELDRRAAHRVEGPTGLDFWRQVGTAVNPFSEDSANFGESPSDARYHAEQEMENERRVGSLQASPTGGPPDAPPPTEWGARQGRINLHNREVEQAARQPPPTSDIADWSAMQHVPHASGGARGPATPDYGKMLAGDFNERIGAMQREGEARRAGADSIAGAYGRAADVQRDNGLASEAQAHDNAEQMRAKIAEVEQLNRDYAEGHIDPDKWWHDKSVPGKIGAVVGNMLAGWAGGVQGALAYHNALIGNSIAVQQADLERKYKSGQMADNLLGSFMRTSANEQEATDKARAAMYGAAMVEVAQAGAAAKGPEEQAQIAQLIADMKSTRDAALAKLAAQKGAAQAPAGRGLEVDPASIVDVKGQQFLIPKADAEPVRQSLRAFDQLEGSVREGLGILQQRGVTDYHPWSANIRQGEGIDATIQESLAKLSSARGVPANIQQIAKEALPQFGSFTATVDVPKAQRFLQMLDRYRSDALTGAVPVQVQTGPGVGKKANELTYWATPTTTPAQSAPAQGKARDFGFQPAGR